ncbi:MAG: S8 family serine peptidase [Bacillota bacterium]
MNKPIKLVAAGLLAAFMASLAGETGPAQTAQRAHRQGDLAHAPHISPAYYQAVAEAVDQGKEYVEIDLALPDSADLQRLREVVREAGGEILLEEPRYAQVKVPAAAATWIPTAVSAVAVGANLPVQTDQASLAPSGTPLRRSDVAPLMRTNLEPSDITEFRERYGVRGQGVTIAVVDSGIDPGHPDLQVTSDGRPKLVDWKDFTTEGRVKTSRTVPWQDTFTVGDRTYRMPPAPDSGRPARFGFWEESKVVGRINRDLDRNGRTVDTFGVLVVDAGGTDAYDLVYVDTNDNRDFNDERPLEVFRESRSVGRLGRFRTGDAAEQQLNFVVADVDPAGTWVQFGFDGLGHGTQVAGVLAANSPQGLTGVAPGAQLMALKVQNSNDEGEWFRIRDAVQYAARNGASVINISLGGLDIASAYDTTASESLNQIARDFGVMIVLATDNTGPGLTSGTTIGNPNEMLAVGAYYSPAMWKRDYGYVVPSEGVWWRTGMGPRADGSYVPNLIAPGGSPTTSPRWLHNTGYVTAVGTSIAAPHVSGAVALLLEAARQEGLPADRVSIQRSLEFGARPLPGVPTFEQGNGLLKLNTAMEHLRKVHEVPELSGQTLEGKGGLLARSFQPGNTSFVIANPTDTLARVNVFSSESWVQPELRSLTMPPKETRRLPLRLEPPAEPGVHSAFLLLNYRDQYGLSLKIPVTYVRPLQLDPREGTYSTTETVGVARYRRYFVEVAPGTARFEVSTLVQDGEQGARGRVQVQVFRPDGMLAYRSEEIGARGKGLFAEFKADQPVEGVWEVVVTALPDTEGAYLSATYKLDILVPRPLLDLPIRLNVEAGSVTTHNIRVANPGFAMIARTEAYGLLLQEPVVPWTMKRNLHEIDSFQLPISAALLRIEVASVMPADADLTLHLYRRGTPTPVWSSSYREPIDLRNLPTGHYQVYLVNNGPPIRELQYQYRRLVATEAFHLMARDETRRRERDQTWTVPLTIYAPTIPGRYKGQVVVLDAEKGETVAWYPLEVSVSQPTLTVKPLFSPLKPGVSGSVVLEVRDSQTNRLLNGTLTVNGRRYATRGGRVTVPVHPSERVETLRVEMDLKAYQHYRAEIRLPVRDSWGAHPTGVDPISEHSLWRRKVESLLP